MESGVNRLELNFAAKQDEFWNIGLEQFCTFTLFLTAKNFF